MTTYKRRVAATGPAAEGGADRSQRTRGRPDGEQRGEPPQDAEMGAQEDPEEAGERREGRSPQLETVQEPVEEPAQRRESRPPAQGTLRIREDVLEAKREREQYGEQEPPRESGRARRSELGRKRIAKGPAEGDR